MMAIATQRSFAVAAPRRALAPQLVLCELDETGIDGLESYSPFCLKVHRALGLAGLPYESRRAAMPSAHRGHPGKQVPILIADGETVWDSTRILARITALAPDAFPDVAGLHVDARTRAEALLWEELADTTLNGFLVAARWADDRNWPLVRSAYFGKAPWIVRTLITPRIRAGVIDALRARDIWRTGATDCWERFEQTLDALDARAPETGFWLGARAGAADVSIYAQLASLRTPLTTWQHARVDARPRLRAWLARVDVATRQRR